MPSCMYCCQQLTFALPTCMQITESDVEKMFVLSRRLYTLHRLFLADDRITPMLVDATWVVRVALGGHRCFLPSRTCDLSVCLQTPLKTAAFLSDTGLSAAVGSTQGCEAGNKQVKHRYHHSSNKNRKSDHANYRLQLARMELIVRRGRFLDKMSAELANKQVYSQSNSSIER